VALKTSIRKRLLKKMFFSEKLLDFYIDYINVNVGMRNGDIFLKEDVMTRIARAF
jgi:hypothetical protein